jgi:hypothetical protein
MFGGLSLIYRNELNFTIMTTTLKGALINQIEKKQKVSSEMKIKLESYSINQLTNILQ